MAATHANPPPVRGQELVNRISELFITGEAKQLEIACRHCASPGGTRGANHSSFSFPGFSLLPRQSAQHYPDRPQGSWLRICLRRLPNLNLKPPSPFPEPAGSRPAAQLPGPEAHRQGQPADRRARALCKGGLDPEPLFPTLFPTLGTPSQVCILSKCYTVAAPLVRMAVAGVEPDVRCL